MKSLQQHIEEKLIIKNHKISTEDLVEQAINNNVEIVENDIVMFPNVKSFISCLDELGIEYTTDGNKKIDEGDILWIEFKHKFNYPYYFSPKTMLICKYARICKAYYNNIDNITIRFGTVNKSTWMIIQGLLRGEHGYVGINKQSAEQLKNVLITLVDSKND